MALDPALGTEIKTRPAVVVSNDSWIRSLDKTRLRSRIGTLSVEDLAAIEEALLITLGIGRS